MLNARSNATCSAWLRLLTSRLGLFAASCSDVFRHGDSASAETVRIKTHARTQMRATNPQHLSDAALAARLNLPASDAAE